VRKFATSPSATRPHLEAVPETEIVDVKLGSHNRKEAISMVRHNFRYEPRHFVAHFIKQRHNRAIS